MPGSADVRVCGSTSRTCWSPMDVRPDREGGRPGRRLDRAIAVRAVTRVLRRRVGADLGRSAGPAGVERRPASSPTPANNVAGCYPQPPLARRGGRHRPAPEELGPEPTAGTLGRAVRGQTAWWPSTADTGEPVAFLPLRRRHRGHQPAGLGRGPPRGGPGRLGGRRPTDPRRRPGTTWPASCTPRGPAERRGSPGASGSEHRFVCEHQRGKWHGSADESGWWSGTVLPWLQNSPTVPASSSSGAASSAPRSPTTSPTSAGAPTCVLLERDRLTSGTTWHAAGLMTCFGSFSETSTGDPALLPRPLRPAGGRDRPGHRLQAGRADRGGGGRRPAGGVPPGRRVPAPPRPRGRGDLAAPRWPTLFPWAKTDDLLAGFHVPGDGRVNPVDLTTALAKGARQLGVRVVEGVTVTDVVTETAAGRSPASRVSTGRARPAAPDRSSASTSSTAPACGPASSARGPASTCPTQAAEHYYLITDTIDGLDPDTPVFEDPAVVRLLPRGGRRDDGRPLRAARRRVAGRGHPGRLRRSPRSRPTGTGWARSWRRRWPACR